MFRGCLVALVTPFRDGDVDFAALDRLVDHVLDGGVHGVVPCGTTGESPTLSAEEQVEVIRRVAQRVKGRVPVVAGTGSNCTAKTVDSSLAALRAGADGVMLVAPYYNKPSQSGLYQHFSAVAQQLSAPIMLYNIPGRCAVEISIETIARLHADHPNIVAVKHATGSVDGASHLMSASGIAVLAGDDTLTWPLMSLGAVGVVSVLGNLMPGEMSAMVNAAMQGDLHAAKAWHHRLFPLARGLLSLDVNPVPIKTALSLRGLMQCEFRLPMCPMEPARVAQLKNLLAERDISRSEKARQIA